MPAQQTDDAAAIHDVTIIGGGPVGLFGAFYAGLRQMKCQIIDSLPELGGQLSTLYPEKYIFDMPGFPKILARDLAEQMIEQAMRFHPTITLSEMVVRFEHEADGTITLTTQRGRHRTRTVIIATGAGAFAPKKLGTPGVAEFEERGVHYFVRNKAQFAGKRLLIVGGGDSAVDWAMNLEEIADKITLIHRRDKFRCHEESLDWLLNRSRVETILWHELGSVEGGACIERASIFDNRTKEEKVLDVDAVLLNIGFSADLGPVREWGVRLDHDHIPVNRYMQVERQDGTIMPGVYSAGDIATAEGKLKLIATGVGEITTAIYHAKTVVDPSARFKQLHSSNMDL
jgi:thioredoxin reductase (NADPH)